MILALNQGNIWKKLDGLNSTSDRDYREKIVIFSKAFDRYMAHQGPMELLRRGGGRRNKVSINELF